MFIEIYIKISVCIADTIGNVSIRYDLYPINIR